MTTRPALAGRRVLLAVLVGAVLVLVAAAAWVAFRALEARNALEAAVDDARSLGSVMESGDLEATTTQLRTLEEATARAAAQVGDPIWRAAELTPFIGDDLAAVRIAADSAHALAGDVALPLVDVVSRVGERPEGAVLDLSALSASRAPVEHAQTRLDEARDDLATIETAGLIPQLQSGVHTLTTVADQARSLVEALSGATALLPPMLGEHEARYVLLMVQNNAELRTGGGITGTFLLLRADNGNLEIVDSVDSSFFSPADAPVAPVPESTTTLYGDTVGRFVQNTSLPTDFAVTAHLATTWWAQYSPVVPDAVLSIDPNVLRELLRVTGPVATSAGEISADTMEQKLLVEPYLTLNADGQTEVFDEVAAAVFGALTTGQADTTALLRAFATSTQRGGISVWSAHPEEQERLAGTTLAGPAARHDAAGPGAFAVWLTDNTGAKLDSSLGVRIDSGSASCREDGQLDVRVRVQLTSDVPADAATRFPPSMTGGGAWGTPPGDLSTTVAVSAPVGGFLGAVTRDGTSAANVSAVESGHPTVATTVVLHPDQQTTLEFGFLIPSSDAIQPTILHTPLLSAPEIGELTVSCG